MESLTFCSILRLKDADENFNMRKPFSTDLYFDVPSVLAMNGVLYSPTPAFVVAAI